MIPHALLLALCIISSAQGCQTFDKVRTEELREYKEGKTDVIEYLIAKGANPSAALTTIRSYDDEKAAQIFTFLTSKYDVYVSSNPRECPQGTLLFHAAQTAKQLLLGALITYRTKKQRWPSSKITQQINDEHTLAACAAGTDNLKARIDTATILLAYGAQPNNDPRPPKLKIYDLLPPLHGATKARNISLIEVLLAQPDIDVNLQDGERKQTPLHVLFSDDYISTKLDTDITIANLLLQKGADPDITNDIDQSVHESAKLSGVKIKKMPHWIAYKKKNRH